MDAQLLIKTLDGDELKEQATELVMWEIGVLSSAEDVAQFMYRGGPFPPQASAGKLSFEDKRPEKKYWLFVKKEIFVFLCTDDKRYRHLWKKINALENKSTTALVGVIATFLGNSLGVPATLLAGFVAVCLYSFVKVGKEAYCQYATDDDA